MAAITGPKVQLPSSAFIGPDGNLSIDATAFLSALQSIAFYSSRSGPTASRPTASSFRWVGMHYYDTTLGLPVFLHIASTSVWHKADGTVG